MAPVVSSLETQAAAAEFLRHAGHSARCGGSRGAGLPARANRRATGHDGTGVAQWIGGGPDCHRHVRRPHRRYPAGGVMVIPKSHLAPGSPLVLVPRPRRRNERGVLLTELVIAIALLAMVVLPLAFGFSKEQKLCRAYYFQAIAM